MADVTSQKWVVFVGKGKNVRHEFCNTEEEAEILSGLHDEEQTAVFFCDVYADGSVIPITAPMDQC